MEASLAAPQRNTKVVGLVSTGHFLSHFYMLLLPPLFPILRDVYGVGFTELGFALTVFSTTTGLAQAPVGFLVDRVGARGLLIAGLLLESAAVCLIAVFPVYGALLGLMVLAGLANSVYHPANYAILNASVAQNRIGRAFSVHTSAGMLGNAVAPATIVFLMTVTDWRVALVACGICGGVVAALLALNSHALRDASSVAAAHQEAHSPGNRSGVALLFSTPILLGVLFFVGISISGNGIGQFSVSALTLIYHSPIAGATSILSAYLFASPAGVLLGGWIADRIRRHALFAALCFVVVAAAALPVAAFTLSTPVLVVLFAVAGLFSGMVSPSRDMLIRSVTPAREMGKVFGFVSVGYNIGGIVSPLVFGYLLDRAAPRSVFWAVALISLLTVGTVLSTRRARRP